MNAVRTGYEIREGSKLLAARRIENERCEQVAAAMLRRHEITWLWKRAEWLVREIEAGRFVA